MSREFDGVDDVLQCASGAAADMTYGTLSFIVKRLSTSTSHAVIAPHTAGGVGSGLRFGWTQFDDAELSGASGGSVVGINGPGVADIWRLLAWRKETGVATPRLSHFNYSTQTWTHTNGNLAIADGNAPSADGTIRFGTGQFAGFGHFRIAAAALWSNSLPWSPDAAGDTAIEAEGLETTYQSWLDNNPTSAWKFNQSSVDTSVEDNSLAGTADQSAITGTTVSVDDPTGFDYSIGGGGGPSMSISDEARTNMLAELVQSDPQLKSNADLMREVLEDPLQTIITETDATAGVHLWRYLKELKDA